jgi:uncharacterized membrane protein
MLVALTALGLAAAAGLSAWIPLALLSVLGRFTGLVEFSDGFAWMQSWPAIVGFGLLVAAELVLDKIPGVDHVLDLFQTLVRPPVGGLVAASAASGEMFGHSDFWAEHLWIAWTAGSLVTLTVHLGKAAARTAVNAASGGTAGPVASFIEEGVCVTLVAASVVLPHLAPVIVAGMVAAVWRTVTIGRRRRERKAELQRADRAQREADERKTFKQWRKTILERAKAQPWRLRWRDDGPR